MVMAITLSLEMFEEDNQTALNDYLDGFIPEDRFQKMCGCGAIIKITGP
jgi:uncharacterized iron-regulated protein